MAQSNTTGGDCRQALSLMIEALGLEIAAIKKSGGSTTVDLFGGEFVAESNGSYVYRFPLNEEIQLRDDTPIRIKFGQQEVGGFIVSIGEGVLVIAVEEDLGPRLAHVRLIADDSFLVERLRERLQQVQSGEARFNMDAASRTIGLSEVRAGLAEVPRQVLSGKPPLNEQQARAVAVSLGTDTTFVWGPPGTGKTTALARIVEAHYLAGRSVLLVSNTNVAVDTATLKIADRLKDDPTFDEGLVLRFGPTVEGQPLDEKYGDQVVLDRVVARLSEALHRELSAIRAEAAQVARNVQQIQCMIQQHEEVARVEGQLKEHRQTHAGLLAKTRTLAAQHQSQSAELRKLEDDLQRAETMGSVRRFFSGLNPDALRERIARVEIQLNGTAAAQRATDAETTSISQTVQNAEAQLNDLRRRVRSYPPLDRCKAQLMPLEAQSKELASRVAELERQIEQVKQEVMNRCRVMATTVYRTYLKGQVERPFDVVVIDEASMLMLPMSFYAAGIATQAVTVAGDFRQLPAIVLSDEDLAKEWLKTDVFYKAGIPQQVAGHHAPGHLAPLQAQYRMREPICAMVSNLFYNDHPLSTHRSAVDRKIVRMPLGSAQLLYVNTEPLHPWASMKLGTYSRYNLLHALLIKKMVVHLCRERYLHLGKNVNEQLGVVAPYAAQVRLVQSLLEDALGESARPLAATVHRFQGNEKDTMLVDLTDGMGCRLGKFMKGASIEEDGSRLLNVAISRARDHVVLVADFDYLRTKAPANAVVLRLLDHFEEHGMALDLPTVLPLGDDDWIDGLHKVMPPSFNLGDDAWGVFTEATFFPAFARDIETAKETILILSPFLTNRGASRLADHFRAAVRRGVRVRIITRPSAEFGGASEEEVTEAIEAIRKLGVVVDLRGRMHEKIAIIDQRVAWHGSLNILSHRDTSECMMRLTGRAACRSLMDLVSPAGRKRDEAPDPCEQENPLCPKCGLPTILFDGRFGIWFECPKCGTKTDARRATQSRKTERPSSGEGNSGSNGPKPGDPCPRDGCDGKLVKKNGRYGAFLSCSKYPRCKESRDFGGAGKGSRRR